MKISLRWLEDYTDLPDSLSNLEDVLTRAGLTVEGIRNCGAAFDHVVVGQILESAPHPNADRLSICRVEDGSGTPRQIVCGAKNYKVGDKVPVALPGAVLPGDFKIKVGKLRGVESEGMLCSAKELLLAEDAAGLLILPPEVSVGSPLGDLFPPDTVLDLEVTPNRPDWLGHVGVAREIAAFTSSSLRLPQHESPPIAPAECISIEAPDDCPFYSARWIRGVQVAPSPGWLQRRLEAVGLRPINNIVDITNYVMMESGQPLHAFDAGKVGPSLSIRGARDTEKILALDGREYSLPQGTLVIAGDSGPLAVAGVMGGESSGVNEATTDILLESAFFEPTQVRRAARTLGLHTDSGYRFERGVDPEGVLAAGTRAAALLVEIAGGVADVFVSCVGAVPSPSAPVRLRPDRCRAVLGTDIAEPAIHAALVALGLEPKGEGLWQPPSWRGDLTREADLIEEVARLHGIDKIHGRVLALPSEASAADDTYDFCKSIRLALVASGYFEARTSTLVSSTMAGPEALVLRNPLGEEQAALRSSLLPSLLEVARKNFHQGAVGVRLFEIGKTFHRGSPEEVLSLAMVLCGPVTPVSWHDAKPRNVDLFDLKADLAPLLPLATEFEQAQPESPLAIKAILRTSNSRLGTAGQLHPAAARDLDAPGPVLVAEISLEPLVPDPHTTTHFAPISEFPASSRDIAIIAPRDLAYATIASEIHAAQEPLLSSFQPFDLYHDPSGKSLESQKKSLAISLTFLSPERTLKTVEVNDALERIKQRLRNKFPVGFRE